MVSDLLAEHLKNIATDAGYHHVDDIKEEADRYILVTKDGTEVTILKSNIHEVVTYT